MATNKRFSKVLSLVLALVMMLSLVPLQSFAAVVEVPAQNLTLKDGQTVAISKDMNPDQVKRALFDAVVENPDGADYSDYDWEVYGTSSSSPALNKESRWGSLINGHEWHSKHGAINYYYSFKPVKDSSDGSFKVRIAGNPKEVTIKKVSKATVYFTYDTMMGKVESNGKLVAAKAEMSPSKSYTFNVTPGEGYKVDSVKVNDKAIEGNNGAYTITPVAKTNIEVNFVEAGTFYDVKFIPAAGVTVKLDGQAVKGNVRVAQGRTYKVEYIPDGSHSVSKVFFANEEVTSKVAFKNYVGTQEVSFTKGGELKVESVEVGKQIVLNPERNVPLAIFADGSYDYAQIRANLVDVLVNKGSSINTTLDAKTLEFQKYDKYYTAGNVAGVSSDWVALEGQKSGPLVGSFYYPIHKGSNRLRVRFVGDDQFRATSYVELDVNFVDVQTANIVLKQNPTVTINETAVGVFDYSTLKQDIFNAAIDAEASSPKFTLDNLTLVIPENIKTSGDYKVTAKFAGSTSFYAAEKTFTVHADVKFLPAANIVLNKDSANLVLKETKVGVYDNAALKKAALSALINTSECEKNGLDVSKIQVELQNVDVDGTYPVKFTYAATDKLHAGEASATVVVTVDKCPTVSLSISENKSATLYKNYNGSWNYDQLKDDIFALLTVSGVEGLKRENFNFQYYLRQGGAVFVGQDEYYSFEQGQLGPDLTNSGVYLNEGGNFNIKVILPTSETYYGGEYVFNIKVTPKDTNTAQIILNEGAPYNVVLNRTKDKNYNYNELKETIFNAAVKEVANVKGNEIKWNDVNYQYYIIDAIGSGVGAGSNEYYSFEQGWLGSDAAGTYHYLYKGGKFNIKLILPGLDGVYHGTEITFDVNVKIEDPFESRLSTKETIAPVTLTETKVGEFDYEALKADIFAAAIDTAKSVPSTVAYSDVEVVIPTITTSGDYAVTVKYLNNDNFNESHITFNIRINVKNRPAADIALKQTAIDAVLKEVTLRNYDMEALKKFVFDNVVDLEQCKANGLDVSLLTIELANITTDGAYTAKIVYPATTDLYGAAKEVTVNVTVDKLPTVSIKAPENAAATLPVNYDKSFDYDALKDEIFALLTIDGVEGLKRENFNFEYYLRQGGAVFVGQDQWYAFEQGQLGPDLTNSGVYLNEGGDFKVRVTIPETESYYGAQLVFNIKVNVVDSFTAQIVTNDGQPYNLTLNKNKDGSYNYTELKKALYEAAVKEVKNVKGNFAYTDFNYQYSLCDAMGTWTGADTGYKDFAVEFVGADAASTYKYLYKGGQFELKLILPTVEGSYHGTEVVVKANVAINDPFKSTIKANKDIPALTLTETTVGVFDVEALKTEIYDKALDLAGSTPNNIKFEELEFAIPEITKTGDYTVTVKFLGNFDYNESSVSFKIHVDVKMLPTANIVLKNELVNAELKETEVNFFDMEALKKSIFEQAVDVNASSPKLAYEDVEITFDRDVNKSGKYYATIKFVETEKIHTSSVNVNVDITVNALPKVQIASQHRRVTLNKKLDGSWNYDELKQTIFNDCLKVTGVEGLTYDKFDFQYFLRQGGAVFVGQDQWYAFEQGQLGPDLTNSGVYLSKGGNDFKIKVSIPDSATYHGASVEFTVDVDLVDPFYTAIVTKPNYEKNFVLNYNANGEFDYDRLKKEIFNAVIDAEKNNDKTTFENMVFKYQILNGLGVDDSQMPGGLSGHYYDFEQRWLDCDQGGTYRYLYKGGNFNVKLIIPASETTRETEVIVNVNVTPAERTNSNVILNSVTVPYSKNVNDIKQAIFNSIDVAASKLPQDVTVDDFKYEYYTINYTAGDLPGVEHWWVPVEGMTHPTLLGSYFKQIQVGDYAIRVIYKGNESYKDAMSNEAKISVMGRDFTISFTDNDIYLDETLPATYIKPSVEDDFTKFEIFAYMDGKTDTTIYIDTAAGLNKELAFAGNVQFNHVLLGIFGIETILSADEVYYRRGLSRAELETLVSHPLFVEYMQYYHNVNAKTCEQIAAGVKNLPAKIQHIWFQIGQPSKPGTYKAMGIAALENYNSAFAMQDFYIRFHTRGTKLVWWQDKADLNVFTAKSFDFSAVVTRNGLPVNSDHVKYIYTGFRANGMFYGSTKNPPREAGIFTQTAYTGFGGRYAFPKTRTFIIAL